MSYVIDLDNKDRFVLNPFVQASLRNKKEQFGFGLLGTAVYYRTYSRQDPATGAQERWADTVIRVVNGVFTIRKWHYLTNGIEWDEMHWQKVAGAMAHAIFDMKMLPPGRGLWAGGTEWTYMKGSAALNNCFAGDETFLTEQYGVTRLVDTVGADVRVLTHEGWRNATVKTFGRQTLFEFTFVPVVKGRRIRSNHTLVKKATADHRWPLVDGTVTDALMVGDRVQTQTHEPDTDSDDYRRGFVHGLVFGDGTRQSAYTYRTRLCGDKVRYAEFFDNATVKDEWEGDIYATVRSDRDLKQFPSLATPDYIAGFIDGWIATDGTHNNGESVTIDTQHPDGYRWLVEHAPYAGRVVTGVNFEQRSTNYGERTFPLHRIRLRKADDVAWEVASITEIGEDTVYCVVNRENQRFTLSGGLYTLNCGYIEVRRLSEDAAWTMDMLMCGVGVGHNTQFFGEPTYSKPIEAERPFVYVIPDSREGWVESLRLLIESYEIGGIRVEFDYSQIRKAGEPIRGFGGTASGPEPLMKLHDRVRMFLDQYVDGKISAVRLVVDVMNAIGACVVAGNVRRSAEISLGDPTNDEFINLKNYNLYPERAEWGWMSNNSVVIDSYADLRELPKLAERVRDNGEPGIFNLLNIQRYGRYGEKKVDLATGANPCAEIPLEDGELCLVAGTQILTAGGYRPIETLVGQEVAVISEYSDDSTLAKNGHTFKAVGFATGVKPVYDVRTVDGRVLRITENHPVLLSNGTWVEVGDLSVGDKLVINTEGLRLDPVTATVDSAYALGHFAGDGWFLRNGERQSMGVCAGGDERMVLEQVLSLWEQLLDDATAFIQSPYDNRYADKRLRITEDRNGVLNITMTKPHLFRMMEEKYGFVPAKAPEKRLPRWYWTATTEEKRWFLRGLFDADGSVNNGSRRSVTLTAANEDFARDVLLALSEFGIVARLSTHTLVERGRSQTILMVRGADNLTKFRDVVYFDHVYRSGKADRLDALLAGVTINTKTRTTAEVASIEFAGVEEVFNLEVEQSHNYIANGLVVHNCNLVEVFPTRCVGPDGRFSERVFRETLQLATTYASSVSLLPTHLDRTNAVVERNRRIGVSLSGIADWMAEHALTDVIGWLDRGYHVVRNENERLAWEAGIPVSVRVTTVKPSGTISLLAGVSSGMHLPPFSRYLRRVRIGENSPIVPILQEANVPHEQDIYSDGTLVFEFPVDMGQVRGQKDVSVFAKAKTVEILQKFWADNMVSNTLSFDPDREGNQIEDLLTMVVPFIKTISLLPLPDEGAVYAQSPIEPITRDEVRRRLKDIKEIDWTKFGGSDGADSKYCESDQCEI